MTIVLGVGLVVGLVLALSVEVVPAVNWCGAGLLAVVVLVTGLRVTSQTGGGENE